MNFESLSLMGAPFEHVETYVYYEGRRTFAMRSLAWDIYYFVNTVDEDEELGTLTTLLVAVTPERFRAIRSGLVSFRDAFALADEGTLTAAIWQFGEPGVEPEVSLEPFAAADLPTSWLPAEGAALNMPTQTVKPYRPEELVKLSKAQHRTIFAVEMEAVGARVTEFPAKNAGEFTVAMTSEILALGREHAPSNPGLREIRTNLVDLQAASFVLVLAIDSPGALMEPTGITEAVFTKLNTLVEAVASGDQETFLAAMKGHNSRVRNRFRDMLVPLAAVESGLALNTVVAGSSDVIRASASSGNVKFAVDTLDNVAPEVTTVEVTRGVLIGLNVRTKSFELVDSVTQKPYKGHMTDEAKDEANGLKVGDASFITATVRVEVAFAAEDEATGTVYTLERIATLTAASPE